MGSAAVWWLLIAGVLMGWCLVVAAALLAVCWGRGGQAMMARGWQVAVRVAAAVVMSWEKLRACVLGYPLSPPRCGVFGLCGGADGARKRDPLEKLTSHFGRQGSEGWARTRKTKSKPVDEVEHEMQVNGYVVREAMAVYVGNRTLRHMVLTWNDRQIRHGSLEELLKLTTAEAEYRRAQQPGSMN